MTIGVLWEFFEFGADYYLNTDMQKDRIVTDINSVLLNEEGKNIPVKIEDITSTIIYSEKKGKIIEYKIDGGYLDIGIQDTMKDLLVNFIGATFFSTFGYLYVKNKERFGFVKHFIPTKMKKN